MAEKSKNKNRYVDDAGIRLAPVPLHGEGYAALPSVKQKFVITPQLQVDAPKDDAPQAAAVSTEHDFQPKKKDVSKKWKRRRRSKNMALGIVMLVLSTVVLLQYILGAAGVKITGVKFVLIPERLGAIDNIVQAIKTCKTYGWTSPVAKDVWLSCIPSLILIVGLIAVAANLIQSIVGLFGAVKPRKYILPALIYLLMTLAVLIMFLVGAPEIGVDKIDFKTEFIKGYQTSELLSIIVFAVGYFLASIICSWISSEKYGYLK